MILKDDLDVLSDLHVFLEPRVKRPVVDVEREDPAPPARRLPLQVAHEGLVFVITAIRRRPIPRAACFAAKQQKLVAPQALPEWPDILIDVGPRLQIGHINSSPESGWNGSNTSRGTTPPPRVP